jgi:hypothetical protein
MSFQNSATQPPNQRKNSLAIFGLFTIVLVMTVALLAVMILNKPASEMNFDTRRAAMVDSGLAELDTYPFNQSTLKVKEEQKINLQLNTKDKSVTSIELIFEVIADEGLLSKDKIKFTGTVPTEMEISKQEVIESICEKDCYTVTLLLNVKDNNNTFSSHDQMKTISQLSFTPQKEGSLKIKISQDSTVVEKETSDDILQKPTVLDFQYYVTDNGIDRSQCRFEYSAWGECNNGWQTRKYSVQPDKCQWYEDETLKELSQKCVDNDVVSANSSYFYLYSNDRCLNQPSKGGSLYVIWNEEKYKNVTWIDVSSSPTFGDFYHKKVEGNIDQTNGKWIIVNGKDFSHATGNKAPLSFEPNQEYFFRLYSTDNNGQHISSARYYITYCSGDQSSYKNCNDACGEGSDQSKACAPGLSCYEGACRNENNPTNSLCLATPGIQTNDRSCNQYCANNNDCGAGLSCFWNRCRAPQNLESTTCNVTLTSNNTTRSSTATKGGSNVNSYTEASGKTVLLPSEAYDLTTYSCNQGCNNNRDCEADMRCYQGKCRLASDPTDTACVDGSAITSTKGGDASSSSQVSTPSTTTSPIVNLQKPSAFTQSSLNKFLSNFSWQWLAFAGAILLAAVALIVTAIARAKRDPWAKDAWAADSSKKPVGSDVRPEIKTEGEVKIPDEKPLRF